MSFGGFPRELIDYLTELGKNNNREWFEAHRGDYECHLLEPAREFVNVMGECLKALGADIHAEPRVRGSIFAINRDIRFSKNKTPYKTYLDLWLPLPDELFSEKLAGVCATQFQRVAPLQQWLVDLLAD